MSFINVPVVIPEVPSYGLIKPTVSSALSVTAGYNALFQSSVRFTTSGPGSITIPGGQFMQVLQTS